MTTLVAPSSASTMLGAAGLTLQEVALRFSTENEARVYFESIRWPNGPVCPHCGTADRAYSRTANQKTGTRPGLYKCGKCHDTYTVTVGTVMEATKIPLNKWLLASHLIWTSKTQISALQLQRHLELGSYRTAVFLRQRVRHALKDGSASSLLGTMLEADKIYPSGKKLAEGGDTQSSAPPFAHLVTERAPLHKARRATNPHTQPLTILREGKSIMIAGVGTP